MEEIHVPPNMSITRGPSFASAWIAPSTYRCLLQMQAEDCWMNAYEDGGIYTYRFKCQIT